MTETEILLQLWADTLADVQTDKAFMQQVERAAQDAAFRTRSGTVRAEVIRRLQKAGSPSELVAQMSRPLAEVTQFVRPSFAKAVKAAQPQALALQPEVPRLEPPRVDRAEPSGNDCLADATTRPHRHKRKE